MTPFLDSDQYKSTYALSLILVRYELTSNEAYSIFSKEYPCGLEHFKKIPNTISGQKDFISKFLVFYAVVGVPRLT
jgi:hypothetical protein